VQIELGFSVGNLVWNGSKIQKRDVLKRNVCEVQNQKPSEVQILTNKLWSGRSETMALAKLTETTVERRKTVLLTKCVSDSHQEKDLKMPIQRELIFDHHQQPFIPKLTQTLPTSSKKQQHFLLSFTMKKKFFFYYLTSIWRFFI